MELAVDRMLGGESSQPNSTEDVEQRSRMQQRLLLTADGRYGHPRPSSTMFDSKSMRMPRFGTCYDVIQDAFRRFYARRDALFSGHWGG